MGEGVRIARKKRQKNTYKAAYLQINGVQIKTVLQVLKECTAMGETSCCVAGLGLDLLASGLTLSSLGGTLS